MDSTNGTPAGRVYDDGVTRWRDQDWLRRETEELLTGLSWAQRGARGFAPAVDVVRLAEPPELIVDVELPGVDPDDIALSLSDGVLAVEAIRRRPPRPQAVYQQLELAYGRFRRLIEVGEDADPSRARASYERGVLTVRIPLLARPRQSVRVSINVVRRT